MARQDYGNARLEVNVEEELDFVEEFYTDEAVESEQVQPESKTKVKSKLHQADSFVQEIQQGLQQNLRAVNQMGVDAAGLSKILLDWPIILDEHHEHYPNELI